MSNITSLRGLFFRPWQSFIILTTFLVNTLGSLPIAQADEFRLPAPGQMVALSQAYSPAVLKGIKLDPHNPFRFHFFVDTGDDVGAITNRPYLKEESKKLIKYFLASLTIPEKDLWVNLSPYEKDRIVPQEFGQTEMGRDLLAEDYLLKQITASLIYPESRLGKEFWAKAYAQAQAKYGTTNVPINTFNKVWIVPDKAVVYENGGVAFVLENHLKVMLEEDYLSLSRHVIPAQAGIHNNKLHALASDIIRQILIPALTKEVNEGKNFAQLRQVFYSLILATWYKKKIKDSILNKIYANQNKIQGLVIPAPDRNIRGQAAAGIQKKNDVKSIYLQYLQAFKKGVYNYIKDIDTSNGVPEPRKYFSGGVTASCTQAMIIVDPAQVSPAQITRLTQMTDLVDAETVIQFNRPNLAMRSQPIKRIIASFQTALTGRKELVDAITKYYIAKKAAEKLKGNPEGRPNYFDDLYPVFENNLNQFSPFGGQLANLKYKVRPSEQVSKSVLLAIKRLLTDQNSDFYKSINSPKAIRRLISILVDYYYWNYLNVLKLNYPKYTASIDELFDIFSNTQLGYSGQGFSKAAFFDSIFVGYEPSLVKRQRARINRQTTQALRLAMNASKRVASHVRVVISFYLDDSKKDPLLNEIELNLNRKSNGVDYVLLVLYLNRMLEEYAKIKRSPGQRQARVELVEAIYSTISADPLLMLDMKALFSFRSPRKDSSFPSKDLNRMEQSKYQRLLIENISDLVKDIRKMQSRLAPKKGPATYLSLNFADDDAVDVEAWLIVNSILHPGYERLTYANYFTINDRDPLHARWLKMLGGNDPKAIQRGAFLYKTTMDELMRFDKLSKVQTLLKRGIKKYLATDLESLRKDFPGLQSREIIEYRPDLIAMWLSHSKNSTVLNEKGEIVAVTPEIIKEAQEGKYFLDRWLFEGGSPLLLLHPNRSKREEYLSRTEVFVNWAMNTAKKNSAMITHNGGIDLNPAQLSLQVKGQREDFKFDFNGTEIDASQVSGATFIIRTMTRVTGLPGILGLKV